ncbi:hypothetical protein [Bradyrhizobium sp. USDA 4452]
MIVDLRDPHALRAKVREILEQSVSRMSLRALPISSDAIDALVSPGSSQLGELKDVDTDKLEAAIQAIAEELVGATRPRQTIDADAIRQALARSKCHYLWFC